METVPMKLVNKIISDPTVRRDICRKSHFWFFHVYLNQYVKYPTADFQKEMIRITEDQSVRNNVIVAFRGSAKSTIMTLSYPIWAILGVQQKKCVLILSQTQTQAKLHLTNIRRELEANEILGKDLGPFREETDEWGSTSLVIPRYNARIIAASSEQSIRGIRHGAHRPDLIVCDDVEDLNSVKTKEGRDKTFNWFMGDVIPCGDRDTKVIIIGNLLHEDSMLMRLKHAIEDNEIDGLIREFPLVNESDEILWPGKFASMDEIKQLKRTIGNERAWQREILLKIIADEDQIIKSEWIQYYDELPSQGKPEFRHTGTGVDLAISKKDTADFTSMVTGRLYGYEEEFKLYILPNPINKRMNFPETFETAKSISNDLHSELYIEEVGYQSSLIQELHNRGIQAEGVKTLGQDKRSRLNLTTHRIRNGQVLFPRKGAEDLIRQLVYFGVEKHDDLADAFAILMVKMVEQDRPPMRIWFF